MLSSKTRFSEIPLDYNALLHPNTIINLNHSPRPQSYVPFTYTYSTYDMFYIHSGSHNESHLHSRIYWYESGHPPAALKIPSNLLEKFLTIKSFSFMVCLDFMESKEVIDAKTHIQEKQKEINECMNQKHLESGTMYWLS